MLSLPQSVCVHVCVRVCARAFVHACVYGVMQVKSAVVAVATDRQPLVRTTAVHAALVTTSLPSRHEKSGPLSYLLFEVLFFDCRKGVARFQ